MLLCFLHYHFNGVSGRRSNQRLCFSEITWIQKRLGQVLLACPRDRSLSFYMLLNKYALDTGLRSAFPVHQLSLDSASEVIQPLHENLSASHCLLQHKAQSWCVTQALLTPSPTPPSFPASTSMVHLELHGFPRLRLPPCL